MPKVITLTHILVGGEKTLTQRNIIYFSCRAAEARSFAGVVSTLVVGCRCRRCTHKEAGPWRKGFWYGGLVTHARCGSGRLAGAEEASGGAGTKTGGMANILNLWTVTGGRRGVEGGLRLTPKTPPPLPCQGKIIVLNVRILIYFECTLLVSNCSIF